MLKSLTIGVFYYFLNILIVYKPIHRTIVHTPLYLIFFGTHESKVNLFGLCTVGQTKQHLNTLICGAER